MEKSMIVRSVAYEADIIRLTIGYEAYEESAVAEMITVLAENGINLDMVVHVLLNDLKPTISFSIAKEEFAKALHVLETGKMSLGFSFADFEVGLAKVSIEGADMDITPEVTARLFTRLSKEGIQIKMVSTSELKMSVVVAQDEMMRAANALHSEFQTT
ncbi:ACT domain-containing protein [Lysinibacillus odysseyi]|uniref:ACT domain-containing protein n=1 Tax=Lysinibacillus odysseyi TaxID=202611 RepID=UPI00068C9FBD|nr:ACT domain-containing protein [Lysinibacillus odysseyi]